jgi:adenylate kinase family enzyme
MTCRVHIMGASGAGVTTLGRALADALALSHHDVDDYYWLPTNPPYREKRTVADRFRLMREVFLDREGWILSGSLDGWGASVVPFFGGVSRHYPFFDAVVFVCAPTEVRLKRLRDREARHFGADAASPGGCGGLHRMGFSL